MERPALDRLAASWNEFDAQWYAKRYGVGAPSAFDHYLEYGAVAGFSPNPFFCERWYLRRYPEVAALVRQRHFSSGFHHYWLNRNAGRSAHWLFDVQHYQRLTAGLTPERLESDGYLDLYDHYLRVGCREGRSPCLFMDARFFIDAQPRAERASVLVEGAFHHYLRRLHISLPDIATSIYFNPGWYLRKYPRVAAETAMGKWESALDHCLNTGAPEKFQPAPFFEESYYLRQNADVQKQAAESLDPRFAYKHLIETGLSQKRRFHPALDLQDYVQRNPVVQADIDDRIVGSALEHFLTIGQKYGLAERRSSQTDAAVTEAHAKEAFRDQARNWSVFAMREQLDFSIRMRAEVSVIVVFHNQFALTLASLASLRSNFHGDIELILVDSGSSDEARFIGRYVKGAKLVRLPLNEGFIRACNIALEQVSAPVVLFLNNDLTLAPGAISAALKRLNRDAHTGAVGGKVVRSHGRLQEAGSIIWRDGSTMGYLRDSSPLAAEANFVRDVDYVSGVFLMTRTALARKLGGFDERFLPCYYEDTDYCVRLLKAGYCVVYDPAIGIEHLEYGSASTSQAALDQMRRNRALFVAKHRKWLAAQPAPGSPVHVARSRPSPSVRILFIEDIVPLRHAGSGFVRSNDIVTMLSSLGYAITVYGMQRSEEEPAAIYSSFADEVEVIYDRDLGSLQDFLGERQGFYDLIWIARTHNLGAMLRICRNGLLDCGAKIILDTEAIASVRDYQRIGLEGAKPHVRLSDLVREEFADAGVCDRLVAVSDAEARMLSNIAVPVSTLGHCRELQLTKPDFADRSGILFVGAFHGAGSPNFDSLCWFADEVLDLVQAELGKEVRLTVVGTTAGGASLGRFSNDPRIDVVGRVDDLQPYYARSRIFIAPTRIAAGVPYKVHEAASFGLPIIVSDIIMRQLGWVRSVEALSASTKRPKAFAAAVVELYRSQALWAKLRAGAAARIVSEHGLDAYRQTLADIVSKTCDLSTQGDVAKIVGHGGTTRTLA